MRFTHIICVALLFLASSCKHYTTSSDVKSGLSGNPEDWTCNELKTEFAKKSAEATEALASFTASEKALRESGHLEAKSSSKPAEDSQAANSNATADNQLATVTPISSTADENILTLTDSAQSSLIGEGPDALPTLPEPLLSMTMTGESNNYETRNVTDCDKLYGKFSQSSDTQILEQCRYVIELYNLAYKIKGEYNSGRKGVCLAGKAAFQTKQVSVRFPYCQNECRFGQTNCVKCTFKAGQTESYYICGEEHDARLAIDTHCRSGHFSCKGSDADCLPPQQFHEEAIGTTSDREESSTTEVTLGVSTRLELETTAGYELAAHTETKMELTIGISVQLKNAAGAPIANSYGGETGTTYSCSIKVNSAKITDIGAEVGSGFNVIVASGTATAGTSMTFSNTSEFATSTRAVPAAGQPLENMLQACKNFNAAWAKNDLPALIRRNAKLKVIASAFMSGKKGMLNLNTTSSKVFCLTDVAGLTSSRKTYRISNIAAGLEDNVILLNVSYDGYFNGFDGSNSSRLTQESIGAAKYTDLRKKIFDGVENLTDSDIRYIAHTVGGKGFDFVDCTKTSW